MFMLMYIYRKFMETKTIVSLKKKTVWLGTGREGKLMSYSIPSYTL